MTDINTDQEYNEHCYAEDTKDIQELRRQVETFQDIYIKHIMDDTDISNQCLDTINILKGKIKELEDKWKTRKSSESKPI